MADPPPLQPLRVAVDALDDAVVLLAALRGQLALRLGRIKRARGLPLRDPGREQQVHARAEWLAERLAVPATTSRALMDALIADAQRRQGDHATRLRNPGPLPGELPGPSGMDDLGQGQAADRSRMMAAMNLPQPRPAVAPSSRWLRWLPAPARWAPLLSRLPPRWTAHALEVSAGHALAAPLQQGELDFMQGRRLGIEVSDLGLHWVVEVRDGHLQVCPPGCEAEASVRGSATDLLALASRLEDADTLFFQRRLSLTGDTELGLTARNTLDRLSWEAIPLALRIVLNRCARVAVAARQAYHAERS